MTRSSKNMGRAGPDGAFSLPLCSMQLATALLSPTMQPKSRPRRRTKRPPRGGYGGCTGRPRPSKLPPQTTSRRGQLRGHAVERGVGVGADRLNGGQAHDDNQRQHHGVFHRGRAIFRDQETLHLQSEILHCFLRRSAAATNRRQPAPPKKLSPPGAATRTSRRPASHRNETQTSIARLVISNSLIKAITLAGITGNRNPPLRQPGCRQRLAPRSAL